GIPFTMPHRPGDVTLDAKYGKLANNFYKFQFREGDVLLSSFPKSGTTWVRELVWNLMHTDQLEKVDELGLDQRSFFLDIDFLRPVDPPPVVEAFLKACPEGKPEDGITLQMAALQDTPRIMQTHLHQRALSQQLLDKCKLVYVVRNPKDVCVAYHHHCSIMAHHNFTGPFENFVKAFMENKLVFGPYFEHVKQAWEMRSSPNVHIVYYEDLKKDIDGELKKLAAFLKLDRTDEQLASVAANCEFSKMRARDANNPIYKVAKLRPELPGFFRKGIVGDWNNKADQELNEKMTNWINEQTEGTDITFKYE
ncbi:unnamed protein product, partial [Meganyctiphanes norvegica]